MRIQTYFKLIGGLVFFFVVSSCQLVRNSQRGFSADNPYVLDTIDLAYPLEKPLPFHAGETRFVEIHHLELDLGFNLPKEEVYGKARLTLSAYAMPQDSIRLDARGFEMNEIMISRQDSMYAPTYTYDEKELTIVLKEKLKREDTITVHVKYTARPSLLERGNGRAISSSQGLYFINANGDQEGVPQQIWSQGETEYNSGWFPSVDEPQEKFTQEVFLTVDTSFASISNGKLMYSTDNGDGTRTDYWKQSLPHSNYLVMIAIGDFAVVKDEWRKLDVWYYLDHEYAKYARDIFGNTPEMMDFYSNILGYDYPWEKFHQIVVKDFVSGAMENTSAVIHGDFVQQNPREMLDGTHEDVIAHELFHHWFGDLVTAESWAQITMNEGFATYGEYLWQAHKYGIDEANYHLSLDLSAYLDEALNSPKPLIRYHYETADDLFDRHSYQKGGRVVHMLRQEVGDDFFFKGLNRYLISNQYGSVEDDHLRLAMEEVTGRDLKWFFDQWYHREGHPEVEIFYDLDSTLKTLEIRVLQKQEEEAFKFHVKLTYGQGDSLAEKYIWVDQKEDTIKVSMTELPTWFAIDPDGDMLWQVNETKPSLVWANQLNKYERAAGKVQAMKAINQGYGQKLSKYQNILTNLIKGHEFWLTKAMAAASMLSVADLDTADAVSTLLHLLKTDEKSDVRSVALQVLDSITKSDHSFNEPFVKALSDSSYMVINSALSILMNRDACSAIEHIKHFSEEGNTELLLWASKIHTKCGNPISLGFFEEHAEAFSGVDAYMFNNDFALFASACQNEKVFDVLVKHLGKAALDETSWWARISAVQGLESAKAYYSKEIELLEGKDEVSSDDTERLAALRNKKASLSALIEESKEISGDED